VALLVQDEQRAGAGQAYVHLLSVTSDSMGPVHEYCLPVTNIKPEVGTGVVQVVAQVLQQYTLGTFPQSTRHGSPML
jgi:hypothetical protein